MPKAKEYSKCSIILGSDKIVDLLIREGANVNAEDPDLWTPLFYASRKGILRGKNFNE